MSGVEALSVLLGAQAFLLAAVSVGLAVEAPDKAYVSIIRLPPLVLPVVICLVTLAFFVGALTAWGQLYVGDNLRPVGEVVIAVCLLTALCLLPALTAMLALAMIEAE